MDTMLLNTSEIIFDKNINYYKDIQEIYESYKKYLTSYSFSYNENDDYTIVLKNCHRPRITTDVDAMLKKFTDIYYDCQVSLMLGNFHKYTFRVVDGNVKNFCVLN